MKRVFCLLLAAVCALTVCCGTALADANPGDEVTVTLTVTSSAGVMARVGFEFDKDALAFVSAASPSAWVCPKGETGLFIFGNATAPIGTVTGTVTFKVKCVPGSGTYSVVPVLVECYDADLEPASATLTGDTVVINKGTHVLEPMDPVYATAETTGLWGGSRCTVCGAVVDEPVITPVIETVRVLVLPGDVTSIGAEAFVGVDAVRAELPANITVIGSRAFSGSSISQISIAAASVTVAEDAFDGLEPDELFFYVPAGSAVAALLNQMNAGVVIEMPVQE